MNSEPRTEEIPPWNVKEPNTDPFRTGLLAESHGTSKSAQQTKGAPLFMPSGLFDQSHRVVLEEGEPFTEAKH